LARNEHAEGVYREQFAVTVVGRLRGEVGPLVDVQEGVRHTALFEKFHCLEGDSGLSDTDRPGKEKNRQRHCVLIICAVAWASVPGMTPELRARSMSRRWRSPNRRSRRRPNRRAL